MGRRSMSSVKMASRQAISHAWLSRISLSGADHEFTDGESHDEGGENELAQHELNLKERELSA